MNWPAPLRRLGVIMAALIVAWFAAVVATGYFLLLPARRRESLRYYGILQPRMSPTQRLWLAYRQYLSFARVHAEHLLATIPGGIRATSQGGEHIEEALRERGSALLLMSHVGNAALAARVLARRGTALTMVKANRSRQQAEVFENEVPGLRVEVRTADAAGLSIIELRDRLRDGGIVSLSGDRVWTKGSRRLEVALLGHRARVAAAPFALALTAQVPLLICFAVRGDRRTYHCRCFPPILLRGETPQERQAAQHAAAQQYADLLAEYLREYPEQWHTFERFLEEPVG